MVEAAKHVMIDLVNALLAEGVLEEGTRGELLSKELWEAKCLELQLKFDPAAAPTKELLSTSPALLNSSKPNKKPDEMMFFLWWLNKAQQHYIIFPVASAIIQAYRICSDTVLEVKLSQEGNVVSLSYLGPVRLLQIIGETLAQEQGEELLSGFSLLSEQLQLAIKQTSLSLEALKLTNKGKFPPKLPASLLELEQWASFRDRPFHPVARAKEGWTDKDYLRYSAEFQQPIMLQWIAVKRNYLRKGLGSGEACPAEMLLSPDEQNQLAAALAEQGLSASVYMAIPVHPWQMAVVLPKQLTPEWDAGICVPLNYAAGVYCATSSARSLSPLDGGYNHVKLPLGIVSLGAIRSLPMLYMLNGERGQQLLEQVKKQDRILQERLFLCDETAWWAYMPDNGNLFDDRPRHLSCMVRQYPQELGSENGIQLIPMSALAAYPCGENEHLMEAWMTIRGLPESSTGALQLFGEISVEFFHICLRLLQYGIMPEIHGQNVILVLSQGKLCGILLRDHDTIRLHLPWLEANGLTHPHYIVKPGRPSSLYNETPEGLLFYLQTLGIQVNLYAIIDALSCRFQVEEDQLWLILQESLEQAIVLAELPDSINEALQEILFNRETWPWKQIIKPLLEQRGGAVGSMPSSVGVTVNPFKLLHKKRAAVP